MFRTCAPSEWGRLLRKVPKTQLKNGTPIFPTTVSRISIRTPHRLDVNRMQPRDWKRMESVIDQQIRAFSSSSDRKFHDTSSSDEWCEGDWCRPIEHEPDYEGLLNSKEPMMLIIYDDWDPKSQQLLWKLISSPRHHKLPKLVTVEVSKLRSGWFDFAQLIHEIPAVSLEAFSDRIRGEMLELVVPCIVGLYKGIRIMTINNPDRLDEIIEKGVDIFLARMEELNNLMRDREQMPLQDRTTIRNTSKVVEPPDV